MIFITIYRVLAHKDCGSDGQIISHVYGTLIGSKMDYGCIACDSANKTTFKLLDTIFNKSLLISLGDYCTTPLESIYCATVETSFLNRRTYLSLAYAVTISATPTNSNYINTFCVKYRNFCTNLTWIYQVFY